MGHKGNGISKDGLDHIMQAALRQAKREAQRQSGLQEPKLLKFASQNEIAEQFEPTKDGKLRHKLSHRIWEMKSNPNGGFDVIRAQGESVDMSPEEPSDAPEGGDAGGGLFSARLMTAAYRGAQYMPMQGQGDVQMAVCSGCGQEGLLGQDMEVGPDGMPMCQMCSGGMEMPPQEAQAPADAPPPAPAAPMPANTMMASLSDICETVDEKKVAGLVRGAKVLVKVGKTLMPAKIVARSATHFDVLLANGATSRVLHAAVSLPEEPKPAKRASPKVADKPKQEVKKAAEVEKEAVDQKAKDYWGKYWEEYGRQLVRTDLPRSVTDHAEPATPKSQQKTPTKSKTGSFVDIGNLWMAEGSKLRTSVVKIVAEAKDKVTVEDPFGAQMSVPRAAIISARTAEEFAHVKAKGTKANRSAVLQAASAALTWGQIASRYPDASKRLSGVRAAIARGIRIALAGGDITAKGVGLLGRAAARAEFMPGMDRKALDEKGKEYYKSYYGNYGDDLVKEIKRRVKADIILRAATPVQSKKATPKAPKPNRNEQVAQALAAHVTGVMKTAKKAGTYTVPATDLVIAKTVREGNKDTLSGTFRGVYTEGSKEVSTKQNFEMLVEGGKVKAVRIS